MAPRRRRTPRAARRHQPRRTSSSTRNGSGFFVTTGAFSGQSGKTQRSPKFQKSRLVLRFPWSWKNTSFTLPKLDVAGSTPVARALRKPLSHKGFLVLSALPDVQGSSGCPLPAGRRRQLPLKLTRRVRNPGWRRAMRCPYCDQDSRAERRFYAECGTALATSCGACRASNQLAG